FFSALKSYKGAFHMSPDYAWWYGYADELGHLATIRDDAERLRSEEATRKRTLFMLVTGPLMVLAVLGAVYAAWRVWGRRRGPDAGAALRSLAAVERAIVRCARCPRLRAYCRRVAREKKRAFRDWIYWGKPVPGFGDPAARLLVVGVAPAAQ